MSENFKYIPTRSRQNNQKDKDSPNISSQDTADVFTRLPDYTIPMKDAYIVCQEGDGGNSYVAPATTIKTDLEKLIAAILNKSCISYVNNYGRKVHAKIFFYGSEISCQEYQQNSEINPPKNSKRQRISSDESDANGGSISESPILVEIDSSQSVVTEQDHDESIKNLFEKIQDLHKDVKTIKDTLATLSNSAASTCQEPVVFKPETVRQSELEAEFKSTLIKQRSNSKWIDKIKATEINFVDNETARLIRQLFIYGTDEPGAFARSLATYIFGEERLIKTLMGRDGKFLKGLKDCDRSEIFTAEEELQVLELYMLINDDLFSCQDAFEYLIRNPINQLGRDLKKKFIEEQEVAKTPKKSRPKNQQNPPHTRSIMSYFRIEKRNTNDLNRPSTSKDN